MKRLYARLALSAALWTMLGVAGAQAGIALIVTAPTSAPPPVRAEHPGSAPYKDAVWVDGRWGWDKGQYVWITGHWQKAPHGFSHWKQGAWSKKNGSWFFNTGQWL
jgi:YXWGXW repeat-containing protein